MGDTPVTVVGTLVSDMRPRRVGANAALVLNFRVAGNERRYDKVNECWVNGESLYLSVSCWRRLAENAASLVKGDPVIVTGRLRTREWTTDQGERRSVTELDAHALGPDLARCTVTVHKPRREEIGPDARADERGGLDTDGAGEDSLPPDPDEQVEVFDAGDPEGVTLSALAAAARPLASTAG